MATELNEDDMIDEIVVRLTEKYPALGRDRVQIVVDEQRVALSGAKVRDFVPVLIERAAKDRLKAEAKAAKPA
ncbi:three-helix bundle dimerization domain-containing protein [Microbacterium sp. NPDC058389]|uniref:three-helix bundle dimerization domain-containing protein n=1 Tax=Microbacterium sp. NPDC058389 TaxID=3346475 RepID=UPI003655201B